MLLEYEHISTSAKRIYYCKNVKINIESEKNKNDRPDLIIVWKQ